AGRVDRYVRAGKRDGRAGDRAEDGSRTAPPRRVRGSRSGERASVVEQGAPRLLLAGRGQVRLEQAEPGAALDARRTLARWLGHGDGDLSGAARRRRSVSAHDARWT